MFLRRLFAKSYSMGQQFEVLARCGLKLEPPFRVQDVLESLQMAGFTQRDFMDDFDMALTGLGSTEKPPRSRNYCANAWHFDSECIYEDGDYRRIAERLTEMAQGSLPVEEIHDHVDIEGRSAWVEFNYQGKKVRINCRVQDDWVDGAIFARFIDLLAQSDPSKVYLSFPLGQDCVIACVTKDQYAMLQDAHVGFQHLNPAMF